MRKARHKKPEAAAADGEPPSKKHDEDGIWDTNLSFEESSTTTTITTGGQVNRRTVTSTVTGLRPPPGFGNGAPGNGPLAGPVTPRTPRASDGDWRINKRTVVEETVEPAKEKTPATAAADSNAVKGGGGDAAQKSEGKNEGGHGKAPGGPSLLDSIFASGEKGARETKEEGGGAKTGESLVLKNLFKNAHRKVFPGLDDDPVSSCHKCTCVGTLSRLQPSSCCAEDDTRDGSAKCFHPLCSAAGGTLNSPMSPLWSRDLKAAASIREVSLALRVWLWSAAGRKLRDGELSFPAT